MRTHPITLEDIENLSATKLLALSFAELNALVKEAERKADKLYLIADWLRGIRTEKTFRQQTHNQEGGKQ